MVDLWEYINFTVLRRAVDLFSRKFHFTNERMTIGIEGEQIGIFEVLIADKFVNKISCFVQKGHYLKASQKIAFIARGSQVDLIINRKEIDLLIDFGQQVYGGKTVLARY
jgi:phosphatidylserine decarboxylase